MSNDVLPEDVNLSDFQELEELEQIEWRYQVLVEFVSNEKKDSARHPIWDLFVFFEKSLDREWARKAILHTAIKSWILNILNWLAGVKWFHTYSDYLTLLWLSDWIDKVREQLNSTFKYSMKPISEDDYKIMLEKRTEELKKEADEKKASDILNHWKES